MPHRNVPAPTVRQVDDAIRAFLGAAPPPLQRLAPRPTPLPGPPPAIPEGELDVQAIGRAAAHLPTGTDVDRFIEEKLRAGGATGTWATSREFRELWYLCVLARESRLAEAGAQGGAAPSQ